MLLFNLKPLTRSQRWRAADPERARKLTREAGRRWRAKNLATARTRSRDWNRANPEKRLATRLHLKFGLTIETLAALIAKQSGACAICRDTLRGGRFQHIDHDHAKPGTCRGVLCSECNTAIGKLRDDPDLLERAARYIRDGGVA